MYKIFVCFFEGNLLDLDEVGVKVFLGEEVGGEVFIGSWVWLLVVWEFEINLEIWEVEEILGKNEVLGIVDD